MELPLEQVQRKSYGPPGSSPPGPLEIGLTARLPPYSSRFIRLELLDSDDKPFAPSKWLVASVAPKTLPGGSFHPPVPVASPFADVMGSGEVRLLRRLPGEDLALKDRLPSLINCRAVLDGDGRGVNSCLSANPLMAAGVESLCAGTKNDSCALGDPGSDMLVDVL